MDREQTEASLIEKARSDAAFRRRLIDDPTGTISSELRMTVPSRLKIKVLEETDATLDRAPQLAVGPGSGGWSRIPPQLRNSMAIRDCGDCGG